MVTAATTAFKALKYFSSKIANATMPSPLYNYHLIHYSSLFSPTRVVSSRGKWLPRALACFSTLHIVYLQKELGTSHSLYLLIPREQDKPTDYQETE